MLSPSIVTQIRNKMLNCRLFVSSLLKFVSKAIGMIFFFWGTCKRHDDKGTYVIIQQLLRCYGMLLTPQYLLFVFCFLLLLLLFSFFFFFFFFEWKYLLFLHTIMNLLSIFTQLVGFQLQYLKNTHTYTHPS